jgi:protocatechuate 3,4-dioxygenase beta subunit
MYFPGDPLFEHDPIFQSVRDPKARRRMISPSTSKPPNPSGPLGYRFDIVLEGREATPFERPHA